MGIRIGYNYIFVLAAQCFTRAFLSESKGLSEIMNIIGKSLFMSVQYITFNGDIGWADQMSESFQAQLWAIIFIASLLTVQFVVVAFFGRVLSQLKLKFKGSFSKKQYIIVGKSKAAELLISDIRTKIKNPYIVYIPTEQLENDNDLYNICSIEKADKLSRLKKDTEYNIVLLPGTKYGNLDTLYRISDRAGNDSSIHITAFLDNDIIRFQDIHTDNVDAYLVSKEQLLVRKYFDECSPVDILKSTHSFSESDNFPYLEDPFSGTEKPTAAV